jgi:outer membrane protein
MMKRTICIAVLLILIANNGAIGGAPKIPENIIDAIKARFPGANIIEVEETTWQGQRAMEIDLIAGDGNSYEVLVSEEGEIVFITEEDEGGSVPLIGGELSFGAATRIERDAYKHIGTETEFMPFILYKNGPLEILNFDNMGAVLKVYRGDIFSFGLCASMDLGEGYTVKNHDFYQGMDKPKTLYNAGGEIEFEFGNWETSFEIMWDISGEHDGHEISGSLLYNIEQAGFSFQPEIGLSFLSRKAVDYLYGVSIGEARPNRPAYSPKATYEIDASLLILKPLNKRFSAVGMIGISTFGNEIKDSPLIDKDYEIDFAFGLMFSL